MEDKGQISRNTGGPIKVRTSFPVTFWKWFARGSGDRPGWRRIVNVWIIAHAIIGVLLALAVPIDLQSAASAVLLPLAGVLVGLSFAWAGNAQALLQTEQIEKLSERHPGGFVEYVYIYSLAIFCILLTLGVWTVAGLKVFDGLWPTPAHYKSYLAVKILLFSLSSITVRECWHVVLAAQWMLLMRREISKTEHDLKSMGKGG